MGLAVVIKSDFQDYYDAEFINSGYKEKAYIYNRIQSNRNHRTKDLLDIQEQGIPVLSLRPVVDFQLLKPDTKILVYTRPTLHNGEGKILLENREAQDLYPNMPGRLWIPHSETEGYTLKYLQIGQRRFKLVLKGKDDIDDLTPRIFNIVELSPEYSKWNKFPIYSIDYIPTKNGLMATDYNNVENLQKFGMEKVITSKEVHSEIVKSFNYHY